ncbi:probable leucine-rich repeat receptor-like protein kinase At5g49770 [Capsicum annuum]|uniref:probable leucine-rich repeat receptor-like protein kinase At5g49770 n=1 Tax=Capsicum annuum TaxID=4072 RepID=UPI001FB0D0B6|nr:probable leucine-rich repeat receptor-like protein kinase At5g49770 [Capsicum annuum]
MQGAHEFKTEIELLSRVHHKNVVGLAGFYFDQAAQMLVYEYILNGTLKDGLSGKTGIRLDWTRRLRIAVGTAKSVTPKFSDCSTPEVNQKFGSFNWVKLNLQSELTELPSSVNHRQRRDEGGGRNEMMKCGYICKCGYI